MLSGALRTGAITCDSEKENMSEITQKRFFYGWVIVAISALALVVSNGLSIGGLPVFYKPMLADLIASGGVEAEKSQSLIGGAAGLTFLFAGFFAPIAGYLLTKLSSKIMMCIGCVILGGALIIYSQSNSAGLVYLAHSLLGMSLGFVGVLVNTVLISNWFRRNRGLAMGIVLTGTSFGGVVIPQIATPLIANYGWRTAMISVSLLVWFILLPAVIFLVRSRPSDMGLFPDGDASPVVDVENKPMELTGMTLKEALMTPTFWIFSICAALIFYGIFVVSQQLNLYLQSPKIGFSLQDAGNVQSKMFAASVVGKFLFGWLSDKFQSTRVMLFGAGLMFASTLVLLNLNADNVLLFVLPFGLTYGGIFVLLQLLVADYFGLKNLGTILGAVTVIETIGGAVGTRITGMIADANGGDYSQGFMLLIATTGVSLALILILNFVIKPKVETATA
jgi:sugar phosphate permease